MPYASNNLYNRPQNVTRNAPAAKLPERRPTREAPLARPSTGDFRPGAGGTPTTKEVRPGTRETKTPRSNDVYAGRDGNVYRRDAGSSWQRRDKGGWQNDPGAAQKLQRDAAARDRGNQRAQSYQQSRPETPKVQPSRPPASRPQTKAPQPSRAAPAPKGGGPVKR
jgi:hypothetical protein